MALNYSRITEAVQALIQYCMPTGSIMPMIRSTVPPGWIQWLGNKKIYETEFPRLYEQLAGLPALSKGTDSTGKYVILPDIDGRVLQACSSISDVGKVLEAQLPNITGRAGWIVGYGIAVTYPSEAFSWSENIGANRMALEHNQQGSLDLWFSANRQSSIYNGSKFQINAISSILCIKI